MTRNQDSHGIRHRGVNRIDQAQGKPRGSSVAWVSFRRDTMASIWLWTDQAKRGLKTIGLVNPKYCYLSRQDSGLQGGDIQVVKPCKCGRRGPAIRLTNVWNGPHAGPCPRRGDASGGMGSDSDGALQHEEEYANVIASTNQLEMLCFVTGPPLARFRSQQKAVLTFCTRQNAQCIFSGPWQGRAGTSGCP